MKLKLLLFILLITVLPISISWAAGINGLTQFGSFMTDGGKSHIGIAVGGDITIKDVGDGLIIKERITQFSLRNGELPELQGIFVLTIIQQQLSENLWDLYLAGKTGFFNQVLEGDDKVWSVTGIEIGFTPWRKKIDIAFGADWMPVSGGGDKTFIYGSLNIKL